MSLPLPPIELEGHCSTIYDNTLYVLSPGGFQSLPLKKSSKWSKEASGVAVTGPACVVTYPSGNATAQFWVIGGTSSDTSFTGLQVYSFATKSWQTVSSAVPVMQGRTNHSVAYLQDSQSILVYAGSQQSTPSYLSSETFVLSTLAPYGIEAFTSNAPPANIPILQPWDSGSVVMVGGSVLNTQISIFSPQGGWQFLSTQLVTPLNPSARGTLIQGSDGSKVLEVYDANVSPNDVFQVVLLGADGAAAYTGEPVGNSSSKLLKRDLTLSDWPPYNSKNAPSAIRTDFSVSQGSNGIAVLAGGNSNTPVAIFNQNQNSWVDAAQFFGDPHQKPLKPTHTKTTSRHTTATSTHTSSSSSTSSQSHTATAAPSVSNGESAHERTLRTLGITLGVLCGIAVLFIAILVYLRWRKLKKRKQEGWLDEKNGQHMSFQDRGTPSFNSKTSRANNLQALPTNPFRQSRNGSQNSLGMIAGKVNKRLSNKRLTGGHVQKNSFDSTSRLVAGGAAAAAAVELSDIEKPPSRKMTPREERSDRPPTMQYGPTLTEQDARDVNGGPGRPGNRNRSSGWSKYFATTTATGPNGISHLPSAYVKSTTMSDASVYSNDPGVSGHTRIPSNTLGPALVDFKQTVGGQPLSTVASRSPVVNDSREDFARRGSTAATEGQKGLIVDPDSRQSQSDSISTYDQSATTSARTSEYYNDSSAAPWSPTHASFKEHLNSRPPSKTYDADRRIPSRGKNSHFFPGPGDGVSYRRPRTPKAKSTQSAVTQQSDERDSSMTMWPKYVPSAHYSKPVEEALATADSAWPVPPKGRTASTAPLGEGRDSNLTIFPSGVTSAQYGSREQDEEPAVSPISRTSDLGWVKLGLNGSQTRL